VTCTAFSARIGAAVDCPDRHLGTLVSAKGGYARVWVGDERVLPIPVSFIAEVRADGSVRLAVTTAELRHYVSLMGVG
jgi:hypothetical protein